MHRRTDEIVSKYWNKFESKAQFPPLKKTILCMYVRI